MARKGRLAAGVLAGLLAGCGSFDKPNSTDFCESSAECEQGMCEVVARGYVGQWVFEGGTGNESDFRYSLSTEDGLFYLTLEGYHSPGNAEVRGVLEGRSIIANEVNYVQSSVYGPVVGFCR